LHPKHTIAFGDHIDEGIQLAFHENFRTKPPDVRIDFAYPNIFVFVGKCFVRVQENRFDPVR